LGGKKESLWPGRGKREATVEGVGGIGREQAEPSKGDHPSFGGVCEQECRRDKSWREFQEGVRGVKAKDESERVLTSKTGIRGGKVGRRKGEVEVHFLTPREIEIA